MGCVIELIKDFIHQINSEYDIQSVYLYGSHAAGTPDDLSDIDIAIILNEEVDHEKEFDIFRKAQRFDMDLEPVVYSVSEFTQDLTDIIVEVKQKGIKIV